MIYTLRIVNLDTDPPAWDLAGPEEEEGARIATKLVILLPPIDVPEAMTRTMIRDLREANIETADLSPGDPLVLRTRGLLSRFPLDHTAALERAEKFLEESLVDLRRIHSLARSILEGGKKK